MATVVRGTIPAEALALHHTLKQLPAVEIRCERIVQGGENVIMPLLWVKHIDRDTFDSVLAADPTVANVSCLSEFEDEMLYQMEWVDHVRPLLHILTNGEATILDAYGWNDRWHLQMLYPTREHFSQTFEFANEHGFTFEIDSIREMKGDPVGRFGLTEGQHRALVLAFNRGYFEVPRHAYLEDLADELDVSHQALSERIRRGTGALVEDTLVIASKPNVEMLT